MGQFEHRKKKMRPKISTRTDIKFALISVAFGRVPRPLSSFSAVQLALSSTNLKTKGTKGGRSPFRSCMIGNSLKRGDPLFLKSV